MEALDNIAALCVEAIRNGRATKENALDVVMKEEEETVSKPNALLIKEWHRDCPVCKELWLKKEKKRQSIWICNVCPLTEKRCIRYVAAKTLPELKASVLDIRRHLYRLKGRTK